VSDALHCWHCGAGLERIPLPFSRRDVCPACEADLHVCRMCRQLDASVAKSCREPVVDEVRDKERANFCDLFSPDTQAYERDPQAAARAARQNLESLFGDHSETVTSKPAAAPDAQALLEQRKTRAVKAQSELEALFGIDKKD